MNPQSILLNFFPSVYILICLIFPCMHTLYLRARTNITIKILSIKFFLVLLYYPLSCHIFVLEMPSAYSSAAYIQVHFRLDLITEPNKIIPAQTAPLGKVLSESI